MRWKARSFDATMGRFLRWLSRIESSEQLRALGVSEGHAEAFTRLMRREGLDPQRPEDVQVMFDRIVPHGTNTPSARLH